MKTIYLILLALGAVACFYPEVWLIAFIIAMLFNLYQTWAYSESTLGRMIKKLKDKINDQDTKIKNLHHIITEQNYMAETDHTQIQMLIEENQKLKEEK